MTNDEANATFKTIFCDIDGTLLFHNVNTINKAGVLLPGAKEATQTWMRKGYRIILTTGRPESHRKPTEQALISHNIQYHQLVMGLGRGQRVIINDMKPGAEDPSALAICVKRDEGLENVKV